MTKIAVLLAGLMSPALHLDFLIVSVLTVCKILKGKLDMYLSSNDLSINISVLVMVITIKIIMIIAGIMIAIR